MSESCKYISWALLCIAIALWLVTAGYFIGKKGADDWYAAHPTKAEYYVLPDAAWVVPDGYCPQARERGDHYAIVWTNDCGSGK